jgi:hypothetical protein
MTTEVIGGGGSSTTPGIKENRLVETSGDNSELK